MAKRKKALPKVNLDFETFTRAIMGTGKPVKAKPTVKKRKVRK